MAMFGATMLITSCDTESDLDVTNPNQEALDANWLAEFGQIDETQDWSLATSAKASVTVYGIDALSDYQLQLYTENPISSNNALLIASKKVTTDEKGNASVDFGAVDVLEGHTVFYACYLDKDYRRNVKPVAMINGIINAQFGEPASSTRAEMKKASANSDNVVIPDVTDPANEVNKKYSQAKELNSANATQNWDGSGDYALVLKISGTWTGNISVLPSTNNQARTLYVDGTWTLGSGEQELGGTSDYSKYTGGLIVVRKGGKIVIPSGSSLVSTNGARIVVLEGGTIEGKEGAMTFCNGSGNSFDYNAGTINIGTMNNNGGNVYNYGDMEIGEFQGGSGNSTYINHSKMYIDHSSYGSTSSNARILNGCFLEAKSNLCCKIIKMGNPSYTHVGGNLLMSGSWDGTNDSAEILMAQNAYLTVDGGVALNNCSIVGPISGYAVCEFGQIGDPSGAVATNYTTANGQLTEGYVINNLYISIDKTETIDNYYNLTPYGKFTAVMMNGRLYDVQQDSNNKTYPVYREGVHAGNGNAVIVEKGQANITIPAGDCGVISNRPGYVAAKGIPTTPESQNFIFACEDLGSTQDVDFNDVVFSVAHAVGQKYITITPLAAGGIYPTTIYYDGKAVGEIHAMLGEGDTSKMLNTTKDGITNNGTYVTLDVDQNWTFTDNVNKFGITVQKGENGEVAQRITAPSTGQAPFMIVVPSTWQWPLEYTNIATAYPSFVNWSQDTNANTWYTTPTDGKVVTRTR